MVEQSDKVIKIIEGMTEATAKRYVELRKYVDDRLAQIRSLGNVIKALGTGSTIEVDTNDLVYLGSIIDEMGIKVEDMLDILS